MAVLHKEVQVTILDYFSFRKVQLGEAAEKDFGFFVVGAGGGDFVFETAEMVRFSLVINSGVKSFVPFVPVNAFIL